MVTFGLLGVDGFGLNVTRKIVGYGKQKLGFEA
jgi:hypothetical protein